MTIPVINTIRGKLGKNIALTMPSFFGGTSPTNKNTDTSTQEDVDAFFGDF